VDELLSIAAEGGLQLAGLVDCLLHFLQLSLVLGYLQFEPLLFLLKHSARLFHSLLLPFQFLPLFLDSVVLAHYHLIFRSEQADTLLQFSYCEFEDGQFMFVLSLHLPFALFKLLRKMQFAFFLELRPKFHLELVFHLLDLATVHQIFA
jgi:hypothetical protein